MVAAKVAYEESRRKRLEENRKRMQELNLAKLAQSLSPKPSPMKQAKQRAARQPVDLSTVRRSSRVADKPPPNYKEVPIEPSGRPKSYRTYGYHRRDLSNRVYASVEDREYAIERAEELQSGLEPDFPSFVKPMLQSHVTGGFWLGLPVHFCNTHLPSHDEFITLLDEDGNESSTKYLVEKTGLSAGWRGFSIDHGLVDGDALVFQLIQPTKFKVFIIRVNETENSDGTPNVTQVEAPDVSQVDFSSKRVRERKK